MTAWEDRTNAEFHNNPNVAIYSIAVLEDAPRFVRGMAVHGMKSGTPVGQRDHFVVVYKGELDLKRVTGFQKSEGADAYILLLDRECELKGTTHGAMTEAAFSELNKRISSLLTN